MDVGADEPEIGNAEEFEKRAPAIEMFPTEERLTLLAEVNEIFSSSLQEEEMLTSIAELVVPRFADWCVIHLRREDGVLHPLAVVGRDGPRAAGQRDVPEEMLPGPILQALRTGGATLDREVDPASWGTSGSDETQRELIASFRPRSSIVVAINTRGRTIGIISFILSDPERRYTEDDLALARDITQRAALAADNARLVSEAKRRALRTEELASAAQLFSEATLDLEQVVGVISRRVAELVGDLCVVRLLDETGNRLIPVAVYHTDPEIREFTRELIDDHSLPPNEGLTAIVLRTGQQASSPAPGETDADYRKSVPPPFLPYHDRFNGTGALLTPLIVRGRIIGTIGLFRDRGRRPIGQEEASFVRDLASWAALSIDTARLYQASQAAERRSRGEMARTRALSEASQAFAEAGLDLPSVIDTVVRQISRLVGDGCLVRLADSEDPELNFLVAHHPSPEVTDRAHESTMAADPSIFEIIYQQVTSTGRPIILPIPEDLDELAGLTEDARRFFESSPTRALMMTPLFIQSQRLGTLLVWRDRTSAPFTDDDESFFVELAGKATLAIEDARLYRQAQQAVREREAFLSTASHELKTPLTTIKGYSQLVLRFLRQPALDREHLSTLALSLDEQVARFETLVNDLLDVSRIQQGRLELRRRDVDLSQLAVEVVARFEQAAERTPDHWFVLDVEEVRGYWDPDRLDQVLTNLLSNALKYSPGGGEVRVTIQALPDEGASLSVQDQGIGIPASEQRNLFKPFERGSQARRKINGTGLGLYITHQIVEQHHGVIDVVSSLGVGSTFTVRLPSGNRRPDDD